MFTKIFVFAILGFASAQHHASSYSSISQHTVQHAVPTLIKTAHVAPIAYHHAPAIVKTITPVIKSIHHVEYPDSHPQYNFKYGVHDDHTGDIKEQEESRDGDAVHGEYTLVQPDGVKRIVHYTADKNGFNADVQYDGHAEHPQQVHKTLVAKAIIPAKVIAPVVHHAPIYHTYHH